MTTGLGGFNDWQGQSVWRATAFTLTSIVLAAGEVRDVIFERGSSFSSRMLDITSVNFGAKFRIRHMRTDTDILPFITSDIYLNPPMSVKMTVPALSNYFALQITASTLGPPSISIRTQVTNVGQDFPHYYGLNREFGTFNQLFAAASTTVFTPLSLIPGPATLWVEGPAAGSTLDMNIETVDENNVRLTRCLTLRAVTGVQIYSITVPSTFWQFRVVNTGGAGQSGSFGLVYQGLTT